MRRVLNYTWLLRDRRGLRRAEATAGATGRQIGDSSGILIVPQGANHITQTPSTHTHTILIIGIVTGMDTAIQTLSVESLNKW